MEMSKLGNTDLMVSRLGLGLSEIGSLRSVEGRATASQVLNMALDTGITFLDTAACYGVSEELIGESIATRRAEFVLSTKAGHVAGDYAGRPWTGETVRHSIERSLARIKTDYLDVVHLHSCSVDVLERGDVIQALQDAKQAGKSRFIGYSGDNESAIWAIESGLFDTLQTSYNPVDQKARLGLFASAEERGMGIIAKRPIANAAWRAESSPSSYAAKYYRRAQIMADLGPIREAPEDGILLALGFTLAHDAVDTAIVGTSNPEHLQANIRMVEQELPLPAEVVEELQARFEEVGMEWDQEG